MTGPDNHNIDELLPLEIVLEVEAVGVQQTRMNALRKLALAVIGGAKLFTGNTLMVMVWAAGKVRFREKLRAWVIVSVGNVIGGGGVVGADYRFIHPRKRAPQQDG